MPRIELIPVVTGNGRQIIFQPVEVTLGERLRRLGRKLGLIR
jgi:hypothetical protein